MTAAPCYLWLIHTPAPLHGATAAGPRYGVHFVPFPGSEAAFLTRGYMPVEAPTYAAARRYGALVECAAPLESLPLWRVSAYASSYLPRNAAGGLLPRDVHLTFRGTDPGHVLAVYPDLAGYTQPLICPLDVNGVPSGAAVPLC